MSSQRRAKVAVEAIREIDAMRQLRLTTDQWTFVGEVLDVLGEAPDLSDPAGVDALARALAQLEFASPGRYTPVDKPAEGGDELVEMPGGVGERLNRLQHSIAAALPELQPFDNPS
jgi:hypothetical protein